ncbi:major intrinsically disordered NOTCH2-binding receptor 1-like [Bombina bombina]|uniref:major intrinsically disordered NOTCH2-binding receptor 1-like n=1 Tax=Bombina bombina TaxID=8345 RepID=UPI00235AF935|nr:major intrinsically disordered NOTCH2-binding receptor 1-like [Bombina bombina]
MDLSVLPNNNHPDKFLRLDVKNLIANSAVLQGRQWHNKVYLQKHKSINEPFYSSNEELPGFIDKELIGHITPEILTSTIKSNPLYLDAGKEDRKEENKKQPSWTIQDYDRHSQNPKFSLYLKENPNDLQYWLEDIYTPGYDSLLKKKEKEKKHLKYCKIVMFCALICSIFIAIVTVICLFT